MLFNTGDQRAAQRSRLSAELSGSEQGILMIVFAAMKCECVYESGFEVISLHTTRAAAYKVCRDWWVGLWNDWNHRVDGDGIHDGYPSKERRRDPNTRTGSKRWAVKAMQVLPDNTERSGAERPIGAASSVAD